MTNHFAIKDRSVCAKKKMKKIRNKNINRELNTFLSFFPICKIHWQDLIQDTLSYFSHAMFRLTFKGTSIAQGRKLMVWLLLALITPLPLPQIVSTVLYGTQKLLTLPHQILSLLMMLLELFNESPFFEHFLLENNLKRILINWHRKIWVTWARCHPEWA